MMESEVRDLSDEALIDQTFRTGMKELQDMVNKGHQVPMKEFVKLMLWAKEQKEQIFAKELAMDKRDGWEVVEHKWCGVPVSEFEIPSLGIYKLKR